MADRASNATRHLSVLEGPEQARLRTWLQMVRATQLITRRVVSALGEHNVTLPQFDILATLRFSEGVTQQELAERLLVTKGNVCGVLDRLEALGWVQRRPDPQDGRSNRLYLTSAGRKKVNALVPPHDAVVLHAMRTLSDSDVKSLGRVLEKLERTNEAE